MNKILEATLPNEVAELLKPIQGESPVGSDVNSSDEYFKLNMEIGKTSPNYQLCVELSITILKEKSKNIWVASWLCFSWFRINGLIGFRNGLSLLLSLLREYGENIYPPKIIHRSKAIQYLNSSRFYKLLGKEEITKSNFQAVIEAKEIFHSLLDECNKQFSENPPMLKSVEQTINTLYENAEIYTKNDSVVKGHKKEIIEEDIQKLVNKDTVSKEKKEVKEIIKESSALPSQSTKTTSLQSAPTSEKAVIASIRKHLKFFFEDEFENKKLKVPNDTYIYSLSRSLVWGKLTLPPSNENITQIDPPNSVIQNKIREWFSSENWDVLIPRIELNFLNPDSGFQYWLDAQRYVVKALESKGGAFIKVGKEIKASLALLLLRFPQLTDLKFKDKETAFANKETIEWINNEVNLVLGISNNKREPLLLPPIVGEDYTEINKEYETAVKELPKNFEENITKMQQQISGDTRRKGQFLRQLNLANLCVEARQFNLAKVHLSQLINKIEEYNLAEWEPALCVAVWQSTYLVNNKLLKTKDQESKKTINSEQAILFAKIANYNGVLAIKLSNKNKNGGN